MTASQFFTPLSGDLEAFRQLTTQTLAPGDVPLAARIERNVPVYDMSKLADMLDLPEARQTLLSEWAYVLGQSAGALVVTGSYLDTSVIDEASDVFNAIIAEENGRADGGADHFATSGANDRIWNAAQKLCLSAPEVFARYFGNPAMAAVCEAWLGPGYQMTAQVNLVRPGGAAQVAHRDYHLGFQTADEAARFPAHVHELSAVLTLQGAIAHCDMPLESGPTKLLPFSQQFREGYMAYRRDEFRDWFEEAYVQVPLHKGDLLFFNPALFHAAGANISSDIHRMANLVQVSSALGCAMETLDRPAMCRALFPVLQDLGRTGALRPAEVQAAIAASADGYAFPTNLDTDPPVGGLAPETQAALCLRALSEDMTPAEFDASLAEREAKRRS